MQHKTIDSVLARGEKLDSLVEKSSDLSAASQVHIQICKLPLCFFLVYRYLKNVLVQLLHVCLLIFSSLIRLCKFKSSQICVFVASPHHHSMY